MTHGPVVSTVYKPVVGVHKHGDPSYEGIAAQLYAALATRVDIPVSQGLEDWIEGDLQSVEDTVLW